MAATGPLLALAVVALVATIGLALGAELQMESHLAPDTQTQIESSQSEAAGDPIVLTGILVAGAATAGILLIAPPSPRRVAPAAAVFVSGFLLVNLAQTAWPNLTGLVTSEQRSAQLSVNLIAFNGPGLPSVFIPIFGLLTAGLLGFTWGARRLIRPERRAAWGEFTPPRLDMLLAGWYSAIALALPFLAIAAAGCVRLMVELPGSPGTAGGLAVLALTALAALGLVVTSLWKAAQLAAVARNPRLAPIAQEAWQGLGRAEAGLVCAILALAAFGTILPKTELALLQPGLTFGVTIRSHTGFLAFLLVPLVPMLGLNRSIATALKQRNAQAPAKVSRIDLPLAVFCCVVTVAAAFLATWLADGALWGWILAGVPAVFLALLLGDRAGSSAACLVLAFAIWALGNSWNAAFQASTGSNLDFGTPGPGMLALARLAGAMVGAVPIWRLVQAMASGERPSTAIPLAAGAAAAAIGIVTLELPLSIWVVSNFRGQSVAMGSVVAAQGSGASWTMHIVTFLLVAGITFAAARAVRPEWFGRSPPWARAIAQTKPVA